MKHLRFKVGDKVLVINPNDLYYARIGIINSIEDMLFGDFDYYVLFDTGIEDEGLINPWVYSDDELTFYKE